MEQQTENLQPDTKIERFERSLLVPITDKERRELSDRTAHLIAEIDNMIDDQKNAAKQAKAQIDERKAELKRVSTEYRDGRKYSKVACERRWLYRTGNYQEVRLDSDDVLTERPLTERERQLTNGLEGNGKAAAKNGSDDGIVDDDYVPNGDSEPPLPPPPKQKGKGRKRKGADAS